MHDAVASLPRMRRYAESLMTDQCEITRPGTTVTDPQTGAVTSTGTLVYKGKCKLQTSGGVASENTEGGTAQSLGALIPQWSLYLHLPYGTQDPRVGDVAVVTTATDPNLTGRRLRLVNLQSEKTHATAMRWNVREVP